MLQIIKNLSRETMKVFIKKDKTNLYVKIDLQK